MEYKKITVVDEADIVIGFENYFDAIEHKLIRRTAGVFVFDELNRVLLQKRSSTVRFPNLFDISAGGHVDQGESYVQAATRELQEELGISDFDLDEIAVSFRTHECFCAIYKTTIPANSKIKFDTNEIESIRWFTKQELLSDIESKPSRFTDGFVKICTELRDKILV